MIARKKRQKNDQFNYVVAKHDGRTSFIPTPPPKIRHCSWAQYKPGILSMF